MTDRNYASQNFVARPLGQRWSRKLQPVLAMNPSRLILAAGTSIYTYGFHPSPSPYLSPPVRLECVYSISELHPNRDITALVAAPGGSTEADRTIFVGYSDGAVERLVLSDSPNSCQLSYIRAAWERYDLQCGLIESLSLSSSHLLSVSWNGAVTFLSLNLAEPSHTVLDLDHRSWCGYLSTHASSPFAAFGVTAVQALPIYNVLPSHIAPQPSLFLEAKSNVDRPSAAYAIMPSPTSSPWGSSDQVIVSGWFDGVVRVHDLRASARSPSQGTLPPRLLPVLTLEDPWSAQPIYSLCNGGGSGAHIVAGSARHSVLAFWDVRAASKGWCVHAPGNDPSPVYSIVTDGPRVFGANESQGFVFDFGGGVEEETYPPITLGVVPSRGGSRWGHGRDVGPTLRKGDKSRAGYYVTKYMHGNVLNKDQ